MLFSRYFLPTLREIKEESVSHLLAQKAGLLNPLAAGIYSYLPLGLRVLRNIETIIRNHMDLIGSQEVLLPVLQPLDLWKRTARDELLGEVMLKLRDRRGRLLCLGPTHEEVITELVAKFVSSYKQLPLILYQIQTKFRDELRPRFGLIRSCEFIMKDAYSFDKDREALEKTYNDMFEAYRRIFEACGLKTIVLEAESGFIGGDVSHEFLVEASSGEDIVYYCKSCGLYFQKETCRLCGRSAIQKRALEIGHIFKLGTTYSEKLGAFFLDEKGRRVPLIMGCYGIGVSRLIPAIIEQNFDEEGIVFPESIAPFKLEVVCLNPEEEEIFSFSSQIYRKFESEGLSVLFDERKESLGVKLKDALLLGIPYLIILGRKYLSQGKVEIIIRKNKERRLVDKENFYTEVKRIMGGSYGG